MFFLIAFVAWLATIPFLLSVILSALNITKKAISMHGVFFCDLNGEPCVFVQGKKTKDHAVIDGEYNMY